MEKIVGETMKSFLWRKRETNKDKHNDTQISISGYDEECRALAKAMGQIIGVMHESDIVHGDLTTSNVMIRSASDTPSSSSHQSVDLVLIDFGLGMMKPTVEDRAVDLYVLERAFLSTHPDSESLIEDMLEGYRSTPGHKLSVQILNKLESVSTTYVFGNEISNICKSNRFVNEVESVI